MIASLHCNKAIKHLSKVVNEGDEVRGAAWLHADQVPRIGASWSE